MGSFLFNDTATTEIYTLSLHDALPISEVTLYVHPANRFWDSLAGQVEIVPAEKESQLLERRSEEHTSELQSPCNLVCRLLLEKKNQQDLCLHDEATHNKGDDRVVL